jgi:hypothetical protein
MLVVEVKAAPAILELEFESSGYRIAAQIQGLGQTASIAAVAQGKSQEMIETNRPAGALLSIVLRLGVQSGQVVSYKERGMNYATIGHYRVR